MWASAIHSLVALPIILLMSAWVWSRKCAKVCGCDCPRKCSGNSQRNWNIAQAPGAGYPNVHGSVHASPHPLALAVVVLSLCKQQRLFIPISTKKSFSFCCFGSWLTTKKDLLGFKIFWDSIYLLHCTQRRNLPWTIQPCILVAEQSVCFLCVQEPEARFLWRGTGHTMAGRALSPNPSLQRPPFPLLHSTDRSAKGWDMLSQMRYVSVPRAGAVSAEERTQPQASVVPLCF